MRNITKDKKIFVAMSGGVDSSVAAALLQKKGYAVTGVFMKNWSGDDFGIQTDCPWEQDQADAEAVCKKLNIPFRSINLEKEYRTRVVEYFFKELRAGRTPNPDVICNKEIKFGIFLEKMLELGADYIATGHYASIKYNETTSEYELHKGVDNNKDQSYFLADIGQQELEKTLLPIGEKTKSEIRQIAQKLELPTANKPDSQGICFIGEINVPEFLRSNIQVHSGDIVDADTEKIIGKHDGVEFYTIGQREGLGIGGAGEPYYVVAKDKEKNILYTAKGKQNPLLYKKDVEFSDISILSRKIESSKSITASVRYRQTPKPGKIDLANNKFIFAEPQRAIAPGQFIVFYEETHCLGCAVIK